MSIVALSSSRITGIGDRVFSSTDTRGIKAFIARSNEICRNIPEVKLTVKLQHQLRQVGVLLVSETESLIRTVLRMCLGMAFWGWRTYSDKSVISICFGDEERVINGSKYFPVTDDFSGRSFARLNFFRELSENRFGLESALVLLIQKWLGCIGISSDSNVCVNFSLPQNASGVDAISCTVWGPMEVEPMLLEKTIPGITTRMCHERRQEEFKRLVRTGWTVGLDLLPSGSHHIIYIDDAGKHHTLPLMWFWFDEKLLLFCGRRMEACIKNADEDHVRLTAGYIERSFERRKKKRSPAKPGAR